MRFSDRIILVEEQGEKYNPVTGKVEKQDPIKTTIVAKLTPLDLQRKVELFGNVDVNIITAITRTPIKQEFDYVLIDDKKYNVKARSEYRKGVLFLEGDNIES